MRPATAVAVILAGIGCLLVLTVDPRVVLYWALVIPSVLLLHGLWVLAIAAAIAVIVFSVNAAGSERHHGLSAPSRGAVAEEKTT